MKGCLKSDYKFPFEKLDVWQKSLCLAQLVYQRTSTFPKNETFGLSSQMQRAAISVSSNIAEGSVRLSPKEQIRFYELAFGSLMEILSQIILANKIGYIIDKDYEELRCNIEDISRMLNGLSKANKQ